MIPGIIYILSYIPFMMVPGHGFKDVFTYQGYMFHFHSTLTAIHPFESPWWSWPFDIRPMVLYSGNDLSPEKVSSIVSMGNPLIWWAGIPAVIFAAVAAINRRDKMMAVVLVAIAFQYIPWALVHRSVFIYHFFSTMPFVILAIVYLIKYILEKYPEIRWGIYIYLGMTAILFIIFYPVISGMEVDRAYFEQLRWLKNWVF